MADSFFTGTDAELYSGSNNFASMITLSPTTYGLTVPLAAAYQTLSDNYASAYEAILVPSTRTKGAVAAKNAAKILLKVKASDLAKIVEGTSTVTDQQKIDLGLNVRATPSPVGPPGQPTDVKVALTPLGWLEMKWKCANPPGAGGTTYNIFRRIGATGEFSYIGGTGARKFTDQAVPAGSALVVYKIQAVRSTAVGEWATFNVFLGVDTGGATMIQSVVDTTPKMAA